MPYNDSINRNEQFRMLNSIEPDPQQPTPGGEVPPAEPKEPAPPPQPPKD